MRIGGGGGHRLSAGTHVASLIPDDDFPLDVGAGYVQTGTTLGGDYHNVHGIYAEGGPRIAGGKHWRSFVGPRAEYYFLPKGPDAAYAGLIHLETEGFLLVEAEAVSSSSGSGSYWGFGLGTVAIGAYIEAGYQKLPGAAGLPAFGGGLLIRLPATFGVACCAWK